MNRTTLIIVAHGSRYEASNEEIRQLIRRFKKSSKDNNIDISVAFLELAKPSILASIITAFNNGSDKIIILPYFLSGGKHVTIDIPKEVEKARRIRPLGLITIVPHIGSEEGMIELLSKLSQEY